MGGAGAGGPAGKDLAPLRQKTAKPRGILIINAGHLVHAERANLLALAGTDALFVSHGISSFSKRNVEKLLEGKLGVVVIEHGEVGRAAAGSGIAAVIGRGLGGRGSGIGIPAVALAAVIRIPAARRSLRSAGA